MATLKQKTIGGSIAGVLGLTGGAFALSYFTPFTMLGGVEAINTLGPFGVAGFDAGLVLLITTLIAVGISAVVLTISKDFEFQINFDDNNGFKSDSSRTYGDLKVVLAEKFKNETNWKKYHYLMIQGTELVQGEIQEILNKPNDKRLTNEKKCELSITRDVFTNLKG